MKVLLLLALGALGQCALLGSKKCTYGPSYWCSHIRHAKECGAMQHCMDTVWKNQRSDMMGSTETCFDVIKVLDVVRHTNDEDFMDQWAVGCTGMPAEKRQLCEDLIGTSQKEVSMLLKSDLSSRQIAAALKLCGGFSDTVPRPENMQVTGDYCKDCINFLGDVREIFNNTEEQAVSYIKTMACSQLGPLQSLCDELLDKYGSLVFNMISKMMDPQKLCQDIGMCAKQNLADLMKSFKNMLAQQQRSSAGCDLCKSIAGDALQLLQDQAVQNAVKSVVESKVCPLLGSFATECQSLVEQYAPTIFEIIGELDPQTVCQTLDLCNATKADNSRLTHVLLAPAGTVQIKAPEKETSPPECFLCKYLMTKLKNKFDNITAKEAKDFMEKLCKDLHSGECTQFVDKYGDMVINLILQEVDPEKVCEVLKICSSTRLMPAVKLGSAPKNMTKCNVCIWVIELVKEELSTSKAKTLEKKVLDKICSVAPSSYKEKCVWFVNKYSPAIANMVQQEVDPAKICSVVELCGQTVKREKSHTLKFQPMMTLHPAAKHYLLGTNKCLFGPSFWCASLENMKLCQTEEHCKKMKENTTDG